MGSNSFGNIFRIMTWGESHGRAVGVVIDGCPAGIPLDEGIIQKELQKRKPGKGPHTSPRKESDRAEIYSGVFQGKTTGTPIMILIPNVDADSSKYEPVKELLRPGHANYPYLKKYGLFDFRGGGRSSARETACRVAAGAVAKAFLEQYDVTVCASLAQVGEVAMESASTKPEAIATSPIFCPCTVTEKKMMTVLEKAQGEGDSLGGIVQFSTSPLPIGLGDPIYEKLEANLAKAMLSIPAAKGFEIGQGFASVNMRGSEHNDLFIAEGGITCSSNHAGGTLGGISSGLPIWGRVAFKPTSSIRKNQETVDRDGKPAVLSLPPGSRHDPCVAIRATPVVEAMVALVLADAMLMNRAARV